MTATAESPAIPLAVQSWYTQAACDGHDTELWFPVGSGEADPLAAAICGLCPVRGRCLEFALAHPRQTAGGVWGGLTEDERTAERRRRARRNVA